jgi:hypothetical protein
MMDRAMVGEALFGHRAIRTTRLRCSLAHGLPLPSLSVALGMLLDPFESPSVSLLRWELCDVALNGGNLIQEELSLRELELPLTAREPGDQGKHGIIDDKRVLLSIGVDIEPAERVGPS